VEQCSILSPSKKASVPLVPLVPPIYLYGVCMLQEQTDECLMLWYYPLYMYVGGGTSGTSGTAKEYLAYEKKTPSGTPRECLAMNKKAPKSIYQDCTSGVIQRGELLFPFNSFGVKIDWDKVLEEVMKEVGIR